jgi:hypothetical protein
MIIIVAIAYVWSILTFLYGKDRGYWQAHEEIKEILKLDGRDHLMDKMKK